MRKTTAATLLLLLLAFGLRMWGLADHNIWWDEGVGAYLARLPLPRLLDWAAHDVHPPLHYLVLRGWWLLVGDGEFVLRFPSAWAGTLSVVLIYGLVRALGGRRAGFFAALFLTLSRFAIGWSQEIRMYAWAAMFSTGALWAAVRFWRRSDWRAWAAYVVTTAGALWSLFLTAPVPLIANAGFLVAWWRKGRPRRLLLRWIAAQITAIGLVVPWLVYAVPRMPTWSSAEPFSPVFFVHLYGTILALGIPLDLERYLPLTLAVFAVLAAGLILLWRTRRKAGLVMLVLGVILPALLVFTLALPIDLAFGRQLAPRYFLPLSVCFYALLGWGVARIGAWRGWAGLLSAFLVVAVAVVGLSSFYPGRARRDDYASLSHALDAHRREDDAVVLHTDKDWPIFAAHYDGEWQGVPYGQEIAPAKVDALLQPIWEQAEAVWLVVTQDAQRVDPDGLIRRWLEERSLASTEWTFGENALLVFARTPERADVLYDLAPGFRPPAGPRETWGQARLDGVWMPYSRYLRGDTLHLSLYWEVPPQESVQVELIGSVEQRVDAPPPQSARSTLTRQQVDVPLAPSLSEGHYDVRIRVGEGAWLPLEEIEVIRRGADASASLTDISHRLDLRLGEAIRLLGYDLPRTTVEPGGTVELTLYWQATDAIETRYKVFTHLIGETWNAETENFLWGQVDSEPLNSQAPTTVWAPGAIIADPYRIPVSENAPPGAYGIEVGLYGMVDGVRLPVFGPNGEPQGDAVVLDETVTVE